MQTCGDWTRELVVKAIVSYVLIWGQKLLDSMPFAFKFTEGSENGILATWARPWSGSGGKL